jgi:hypothetical protein
MFIEARDISNQPAYINANEVAAVGTKNGRTIVVLKSFQTVVEVSTPAAEVVNLVSEAIWGKFGKVLSKRTEQ